MSSDSERAPSFVSVATGVKYGYVGRLPCSRSEAAPDDSGRSIPRFGGPGTCGCGTSADLARAFRLQPLAAVVGYAIVTCPGTVLAVSHLPSTDGRPRGATSSRELGVTSVRPGRPGPARRLVRSMPQGVGLSGPHRSMGLERGLPHFRAWLLTGPRRSGSRSSPARRPPGPRSLPNMRSRGAGSGAAAERSRPL